MHAPPSEGGTALDSTVGPFLDALLRRVPSERSRTGCAEALRWAAGLCSMTGMGLGFTG